LTTLLPLGRQPEGFAAEKASIKRDIQQKPTWDATHIPLSLHILLSCVGVQWGIPLWCRPSVQGGIPLWCLGYDTAEASNGEFPYSAWAQHSGIVLNFDTCLLLLICDDTDLLYRPCLWQKCLFPDPRVLGVQRTWRHSLALRARDPGAVWLVFCPSVQAKQGLYRDSRAWDYPAEEWKNTRLHANLPVTVNGTSLCVQIIFALRSVTPN